MNRIVLTVIVLFCAAGALAREVTVEVPKLKLRTAPSFLATLAGEVMQGATLTVVGSKGAWLQVRDAKGNTGWLTENSLTSKSAGLLKAGDPGKLQGLSTAEMTASIRGVLEVKDSCGTKLPASIKTKIEQDLAFVFGVKQAPGLETFLSARGLKPREHDGSGVKPPVDLDTEMQIAQASLLHVLGRNKVLRNETLGRYLSALADHLGGVSDRTDLPYYIIPLDSKEANSFSLPGGFIFITRGLLAMLKDEALLVAVLAHEIVHVARYHGLAELERTEVRTKSHAAKAEAGLDAELSKLGSDAKLKERAYEDLAGDACKLSTLVNKWVSSGRAQADEYEADRYATVYLYRAGYDPAALTRFLTLVGQRGKAEVQTFAAHHPPTSERIKKANAYISGEGLEVKVELAPLQRTYKLNVQL